MNITRHSFFTSLQFKVSTTIATELTQSFMRTIQRLLPIACFGIATLFLSPTVQNYIAPTGTLTKVLRATKTMSSTQTTGDGGDSIIPRYNGPALSEMNPQQKDIHDFILRSRPRTGLSGPFGPWLGVPEIAEPASQLGKACRYDTSLSSRESELVILLTGAKMRSQTEFVIHIGEALKAGIAQEVIDAIPRDDEFSLSAVQTNLVPKLGNAREKAIVSFVAELLDTSTVSEGTYESTKKAVDNKDSVLVEITSIVGYYTFVSYTLNVFQIPAK